MAIKQNSFFDNFMRVVTLSSIDAAVLAGSDDDLAVHRQS
jgi:hypothetical protein